MKNIELSKNNWIYFSKGKRSTVYLTNLNNKKIVIKVYKQSKELKNLALKEAKNLILLNKKNIGPRLIYYDNKKIVYYFIEGLNILDYFNSSKKSDIKKAIINSLNICFTLDKLNINKKEMTHPLKHILIKKNKVNFIDFERASITKNPKNTSQFYNFLTSNRVKDILDKKGIKLNKSLELIKMYKLNQNKKNYQQLINNLFID